MNTTHSEYIQNSKLQVSKMNLVELEGRARELKLLCDQIDPYHPLDEEMKKRLAKFHITEYFDPFTITNKLLILVEDTLEEIQKLKNKR